MINPTTLKLVIWMGSSRKDFCEMPSEVQDAMGYALFVAQQGGKHHTAKPLKGFGGAGVHELVSDYRGDSFRAVYTVRFPGAVYLLHAFQKKSKKGGETPKADMELIKRRLRDAETLGKGEGA